MSVLLDAPVWLLAALIVAAVAFFGWVALRALPTSRRLVAVVARTLLGLALAAALAGPQLVQETKRLGVVVVLDRSGSVESFAGERSVTLDQLASALEETSGREETRLDEDLAAILAFDGATQVVSPMTLAPIVPDAITPIESDATDIAQALARAQALVPSDALGRVVLISDGVNTRSGIDDLVFEHPVDVYPIEYSVTDEIVLESVRTPTNVTAGSLVPVEVTIRAASGARGDLSIDVNGQRVDLNPGSSSDALRVSLEQGVQTLLVSVPVGSGRVHRVSASFEPERDGSGVAIGDTSVRNNTSSSISLARDQGNVLVVATSEQTLTASEALTRLIESRGWTLETTLAPEMPTNMIELERYDLVVMLNTPFDAIPSGADTALDRYARDLGGGLLFVSGPESLGAGAWQSSEHASMFPLRLDVPDDVVRSNTAVVLVLDSSGSMRRSVLGSSRSQQQVANESAAGAIDVLDPTDEIGVISFNESARLVVELARHDDLPSVKQRVMSISAGGGTDLGPALELAREQLAQSDAKSKHVVVLSDGASKDADTLPGLAQSLQSDGIKVSTITIGDQADEQTMRLIATESGGVYYRVVNPGVLPRVFLKAVRVLRKPMIREGAISPIVVDRATPMFPAQLALPDLSGIVLTEFLSDDPRVMVPLVSEQGEPILAGHQYELGRVGVFTSDVSDWAQAWVTDPVFDAFFTGVLAWTTRSADPGIGELRVDTQDSGVELTYSLIEDSGAPIDGAQVRATLLGPSGISRDVTLEQTGPGLYSASAERLGPGDHIVLVTPSIEGEPQRPSIGATHINPTLEYASLRSDRSTLESIASRSDGRVLNATMLTSDVLFSRDGIQERRSYEPIWRALLFAALALFLIDLVARRVAWDRWISEARADTIAVTQRTPTRPVPSTAASEQFKVDNQDAIRASESSGPIADPSSEDDPVLDREESSFMAAKRRARQRFNDD